MLDSRVHDMGLRAFGTNGIPKGDSKQLLLGEMFRQDKEDSIGMDWIGGRGVDSRLGVSDSYLVLDSVERDLNSSNIKEGLFKFIIRGEGITGDGYIGTKIQLHNIIEIEANSFIFPVLPCRKYTLNEQSTTSVNGIDATMPILVPNVCEDPMTVSEIPCYPCNEPDTLPTKENYLDKDPCSACDPCTICPDYLSQLSRSRIQVAIQEVSEQAISDAGGKHHSLEFDVVNYNRRDAQLTNIYASPINFGYIFTDPINHLDTLTIIFRNHMGMPITFNPDLLNNSVLNCVSFVYSNTVPVNPDIPANIPYPVDTLLPTVPPLPPNAIGPPPVLGPNEALPAIPPYYRQFLEVVTESLNGYNTEGALKPNFQISFKHINPTSMNPKLYKYITKNMMLVGANGYDPLKSFRLNPDVIMTEFISAYSKNTSLITPAPGYLTISRTTKRVPMDYTTQILLREWKDISQPYPLPQDPLPAGNNIFDKFVETQSFNIITSGGQTYRIAYDTQVISWNGNNYHVKDPKTDIFYDRVILTETNLPDTPIVDISGNAVDQGVFINLRFTTTAIPKPTKNVTRIRLKPGQFVVEPNLRTGIYDLIEGKSFVFDGQYVNDRYDATASGGVIPPQLGVRLMPVIRNVNTPGMSIRLFHQGGVDGTTGVFPTNIIPQEANGVYHLEVLTNIYADKIVLTPGFSGGSDISVIIAANRIRMPLRIRKLLRRMTNLLAP